MRHRQSTSEQAANAEISRRQWLSHVTAQFGVMGTVGAAGGLALPRTASAIRIGEADTSRKMRERVIQSLPLRQLSAAARNKVTPVIERPTLFRRMPTERIICEPELFVLLVRYPEIVVNMWQLLGATKLTIDRIDKYRLDSNDGAGTQTRVELLYGTKNLHLLYANGSYSGALFRRDLLGDSVLALHSQFTTNNRGEPIVTCTLDVFVALQNIGVDFVAKTLHPLMGKTADHNFAESARFVSQVSEQTRRNPDGMERLSQRLKKVEPSVRQQFVGAIRTIAGNDHVAARQQQPPRETSAPPSPRPSDHAEAGMSKPPLRRTSRIVQRR